MLYLIVYKANGNIHSITTNTTTKQEARQEANANGIKSIQAILTREEIKTIKATRFNENDNSYNEYVKEVIQC